MIDNNDSSNKRPLRITSCPDNTSIVARYPKAAPGSYTLVVTSTASGTSRRIPLLGGGNNSIAVGVTFASNTPTTGNGGLVTLTGTKLPAGGAGAQDGVLAEYQAFVGDKEVAITNVDAAAGTVTINVPSGLYANGEQSICVLIDLVSINCGDSNALSYTFNDQAVAPDATLTLSFDDSGDLPTLTIDGVGFYTDKSTYSLSLNGIPLASEFTLSDLITVATAT